MPRKKRFALLVSPTVGHWYILEYFDSRSEAEEMAEIWLNKEPLGLYRVMRTSKIKQVKTCASAQLPGAPPCRTQV